MSEEKKVNPVEIVVDLLEVKARSIKPFSASEHEANIYQRAQYEYQYAIISHAVALICDKYDVRAFDIDDELHKRSNAANNPLKGII